jgi:cellobiose phosphorylase
MGSGDWNDGMNRVGEEGKGESVWLAFFLYQVLQEFSEISLHRGDLEFVKRCVVEMNRLKKNVEENAWDGRWFRRAYFDNGTPLGSQQNTECQIDSIPQSWAVLSGLGQPEQIKIAMDEVYHRLVDRNHALIRLFDPPFEKSVSNPGYIQGYVPGVRENGGQYTHAAIWAAMGFAAMGDQNRAWELTSFLNPILHGSTSEQIAIYRAEPYVMAADVYAAESYVGRGGWTWYTGSAGWMYRLIVESLLGLRLEVDKLYFQPCLPNTWKSFKIHYRYRETFFHITVLHGGGNIVKRVILDGEDQPDKTLPLIDDRRDHFAEMETE